MKTIEYITKIFTGKPNAIVMLSDKSVMVIESKSKPILVNITKLLSGEMYNSKDLDLSTYKNLVHLSINDTAGESELIILSESEKGLNKHLSNLLRPDALIGIVSAKQVKRTILNNEDMFDLESALK